MPAVKLPVDSLPDVALVPDQSPDAVQEVELVEDQLIVVALPKEMEVLTALIEVVGRGVGAAPTLTETD